MALWEQDPRYDETPSELRPVVELVLGDLQGAAPIPVHVGLYRGPMEAQLSGVRILVFSEPGGGGAGWAVDDPSDIARVRGDTELALSLAEYLQEQFFPETAAAWGEARPSCPGHPHPAEPAEIDGGAWWTCPADRRRFARFGELSAS